MDQLTPGRHRSSGRQRRHSPQRGNVIAIALAALAVVLAGTGTAVAVTATTTISDPSVASRIAHVDSFGRLNTTGPISTFNIATAGFTNSAKNLDVFSSPTTASLAVTKFSVVNGVNNVGRYAIFLFQAPVLSDGTCSLNTTVRTLAFAYVSPGAQAVQDYTVPLTARAVSGAKYCLDLYLRAENSAAAAGESLSIEIAGYVAGGTYAGAGAGATPARTLNKAQVTAGR